MLDIHLLYRGEERTFEPTSDVGLVTSVATTVSGKLRGNRIWSQVKQEAGCTV